ncbi:MAG: MMPL family transporter [Halorubrum sp.]
MSVQALVGWTFTHRRAVIVLALVLTAGFGVGALAVEETTSLEGYQIESEQREALEYTQDEFAGGENETTALVVVEADDVLERDVLLTMPEYQQRLRENATVGETLVEDEEVWSIANAVATIAYIEAVEADREASGDEPGTDMETSEADPGAREDWPPEPSPSEQRDALADTSEEELERLVAGLLERGDEELLRLLPQGYEPGETSAEATVIVVTQDTDGEWVTPDVAPDHIVESQHAMDELAPAAGPEFTTFGSGITAHDMESSMDDSIALLGSITLFFVLTTLVVASRDPVDVSLGLLGIVVVLVWTFGFMGITGIKFGPIFVAVPVLLVGLSIDYAIHVFMRGREARTGTDRSVEEATKAGIAGVGFALVLSTTGRMSLFH